MSDSGSGYGSRWTKGDDAGYDGMHGNSGAAISDGVGGGCREASSCPDEGSVAMTYREE